MTQLTKPTVESLQQEIQVLRHQLDSLLAAARDNESKMRRFDELERSLIAVDTVPELLRVLLGEYQSAFGVEQVSVALVDRDGELRRLLASEIEHQPLMKGLLLLDRPDALERAFTGHARPRLMRYEPTQHHDLFASGADRLGSVALLPLWRHGHLIGSLHFGSRDVNRYASDAGTEFLERMSSIAAVCLEGALAQERIKLAGLTDALTGVHNRRYFDHRCLIEISLAIRHRQPLACLFLDIDHFKAVNDQHGHPAGDEVLRQVGGLIKAQLRLGDTIARYGGEEFVVLLPRTSLHFAQEIAERIRQGIASRALPTGGERTVAVTASLGVVMFSLDPQHREPRELAEQLVGSADKALYQAKQGGRNRVVCLGGAGSYD